MTLYQGKTNKCQEREYIIATIKERAYKREDMDVDPIKTSPWLEQHVEHCPICRGEK